jgi:hypothetical protein
MSPAGIPLFSAAALAVLDRQPFDPTARGSYEMMSGGLIWRDEFPEYGSPEWQLVATDWVYRYLIGYRASITLGEERAELRPVWGQVVQGAPNWPGLREERRGDNARRRLSAARQSSRLCLDEVARRLGLEDG